MMKQTHINDEKKPEEGGELREAGSALPGPPLSHSLDACDQSRGYSGISDFSAPPSAMVIRTAPPFGVPQSGTSWSTLSA